MSDSENKVNLTWENAGLPTLIAIVAAVSLFVYLYFNSTCIVPSGWLFLWSIFAWVIFVVLLFGWKPSRAFAWLGFSCLLFYVVGSYVPEDSFSRSDVCHDPRTGEVFTQGGGYWKFGRPFVRSLECVELQYGGDISDCGWVGDEKYEIHLALLLNLNDDKLKGAALLIMNYHKVVSGCSGFTRWVPEGSYKIKKDQRVVELGAQMDECAAVVWSKYDDTVARADIKVQPATPACDFSGFGLTFETLRIERQLN